MSTPTAHPADAAARDGWYVHAGLRLHYLEWGPQDAPAIVAMHGLRSYAATWAPVAEALCDRYRLVALDHRGRGLSDWDPQRNYYAAAYVGDLQALVAALGLRRYVLLGHSMGGANAFIQASSRPDEVAGLAIEDMGPGASLASGGSERIKRELAATPDAFGDWAQARAFWRSQRPLISEAALDSRLAHSLKEEGGRVTWRHDAAGIAQARIHATPDQLVDLWPHVDALRMPTLVLRGGDSDFLSAATAAEMQRRNPRIASVAIAGASHYVHDDQLAAFNAALVPWLDGLDDARWRAGSGR